MTKLETTKDITSWTCECNCVTFDGKVCRACGKSPAYGNIDAEEQKQLAIKWAKDPKKLNKNWFKNFLEFHNITEEDLIQ